MKSVVWKLYGFMERFLFRNPNNRFSWVGLCFMAYQPLWVI